MKIFQILNCLDRDFNWQWQKKRKKKDIIKERNESIFYNRSGDVRKVIAITLTIVYFLL